MSNNRFDLPESAMAAVRGIMQGNKQEQIDELSKKTLQSYGKKAEKSADKAWDNTAKEEDKAMATDGIKYPEKQQRHNDAAEKHLNVWRKRDAGLKMADKKLTKEGVEELDEISKETLGSYIDKADKKFFVVNRELKDRYHTGLDPALLKKSNQLADGIKLASKKYRAVQEDHAYIVMDEEFGFGEVLSINEDTAQVVFEGRIEEYSTDDIFVEEVEDITEISKETLKSYVASAKADPAFDKKRGKPSKATVAIRTKRTSGLEDAKSKLEAIYNKEYAARTAHTAKLRSSLDAHFDKEAPKILAKHGFNSISTHPNIDVYAKKHDNGHMTTVAVHKDNNPTEYSYHGKHTVRVNNTKGMSWSQVHAHEGVRYDEHHAKNMTDMLPKFENHIIQAKNEADSDRSW